MISPTTNTGELPLDGWAQSNGVRLHYRDWGGEGRSMVLVHGLASTSRTWDLTAPLLARRFRVVAIDQRGHGESDRPDSGYDFDTVATDLQGFLEALGLERPILVGHSWGGGVVLKFGRMFQGSTAGICLLDGGTMELSMYLNLEEARARMTPPDFSGYTLAHFRKRLRGYEAGMPITPEIEDIIAANFEELHDGTMRARLSRANHMAIVDHMWTHKPSEIYPEVRVPVLLMPTMRDGNAVNGEWSAHKAETTAIASRLLPVSKTVWLKDSVHDVQLQRPQLVADTIARHVEAGFLGTA